MGSVFLRKASSAQSMSMARSHSLICRRGLKLAIWPRTSLAHEAHVPLGPRSATEFMLGHNVASKAEVDAVMARAKLAGAVITDPAHDAVWGDYIRSFQDPDGHLWEVVWNPDWELLD